MTTPTANPEPEPDLTPKAVLPITHALVLFSMKHGQPEACAAVEFREDGHLIVKGSTPAYCTHFTQAAAEVTARAIITAVQTEINTPSQS